jgi:hypothetical protein
VAHQYISRASRFTNGFARLGRSRPADRLNPGEVTTTTRPEASDALHRLIWRLPACAWLNTRDVQRIRSVGIYLARYGAAVA